MRVRKRETVIDRYMLVRHCESEKERETGIERYMLMRHCESEKE